MQKFQCFFQKSMSSNHLPPPPTHTHTHTLTHTHTHRGTSLDFFWKNTFRSRCLHMLRNPSLEHKIFCVAKIKSTLNVFKHKPIHAANMMVNQTVKENLHTLHAYIKSHFFSITWFLISLKSLALSKLSFPALHLSCSPYFFTSKYPILTFILPLLT